MLLRRSLMLATGAYVFITASIQRGSRPTTLVEPAT